MSNTHHLVYVVILLLSPTNCVLSILISNLNAKLTTEQALMNSANVTWDKNCGKKKTKPTQKRKWMSSNKPQKIAKLLPFLDRGELGLPQPPSTSWRHTNTVSAKPHLQQSFRFWNLWNLCYQFFDTSKRFKRLASRCYSFITIAKNSSRNLTAKAFTKSKSNKLPHLPKPCSEFVCHCHTKVLP